MSGPHRVRFPRRRHLLAAALLLFATPASAQNAQQAAIESLIAELDYLIDSAEALAREYRDDDAPVRFNYGALIEQLRTTRNHSATYLNTVHTVVHAAPPETVDRSLTEVR